MIVLGDLNEGPKTVGTQAENLATRFDDNSPLVDVYSLPGFDLGRRPARSIPAGSATGWTRGGAIFRKGLWGHAQDAAHRLGDLPEMANGDQQASDHAAVYVDLNL